MPYDLMTYTYYIKDTPNILLFCRDTERNRRTFQVSDFRPYFWRDSTNSQTLDVFGRPVEKVVCKLPSEVATLRETCAYHCEADIRFPLRFLIDRGIFVGLDVVDGKIIPAESINVPPKVVYFDLEVMSPAGVLPSPWDPQHPIVSVQCSSNYDNELHLFTTSKGEVPADIHGQRSIVHKAGTERELLLEFARWIQQYDPDVLTGYNANGFDFPYLLRRAQRIGAPISLMSPLRVAEMRRRKAKTADVRLAREWEVHIPGRECIDLLELYQKVTGGRQGVQVDEPWGLTFDFKWVVQRETGFSYVDYGDSIEQVYDRDVFLEYIRNDAVALKLLDERLGLIRYLDGLRRIVGCSLTDALSNKKLIDTFALRIRDRPLPSATPKPEAEIAGGLVVSPPRVGTFENVAVFDLRSLYPSIIIGFNISPETKSPDGEIIIGQWRYKRRPEGILPKVCRMFLSQRDQIREQLKRNPSPQLKQLETLYKYLVCSVFGVAGYPGFRLFDPDVANSITFMGRQLVQLLRLELKRNGYEAVYSDTDSIFVQLRTSDRREAYVVEYILQEALRKYSRQFGASLPEVKFERLFRRILFKASKKGAVKKKYAGYTDEGLLYIIGFEPRRGDTAELTRRLMRDVFVDILVRDDVDSAVAKVVKAWNEIDKYPVGDVAIPKSLRKRQYQVENPWLRGVEYSSRVLGKVFREDKRPRLLYVRKVDGYPQTDVVCLTEDDVGLPKGFYVDWGKMRDLVIRRKFEGVFESLGISWDEIVSGTRQQTLGRWFNGV